MQLLPIKPPSPPPNPAQTLDSGDPCAAANGAPKAAAAAALLGQGRLGCRGRRGSPPALPGQGHLSKWHLEPGLVSELCYPHLQSQLVTATALGPASGSPQEHRQLRQAD